jgi:prepilin-type N-terminal cleavage/methylation domain-containing protein
MRCSSQSNSFPRRHRFARRGFTLAELVASMAILTILMGAMTSVIVVASHAIPDAEDPVQSKLATMDVVEQIGRELYYATSITEATATAITFTVPDRGHGAAGPETIRYAWSGTAGDPLTRQYNGGTAINVSTGVQFFSFSLSRRVGELQDMPSVLLMVNNDVSPSAQDMLKQSIMESWGFIVQLSSVQRTLAEQRVILQTSDIIYLAKDISTVPAILSISPNVGIVCEESSLYPDVGISTSSTWASVDSIEILDNTHEITKPFSLGPLNIFSSKDIAAYARQTIAPGGQILADDGFFSEKTLIAIEFDATLSDGAVAPARRVSLPWGTSAGMGTFDFNNVNNNGLTIMRRAITWASAPIVVSGVSVTLQVGTDSRNRAQTQVQLLNTPRAP